MAGGELHGTGSAKISETTERKHTKHGHGQEHGDTKRVIVVHCKAGKGRSGTMACSYLISECGWTPEDAIARFTERRMKPMFGAGVSIPSQLRWISYVDRWTKGGKKYVDRPVEVLEVHVWGLRHGVKLAIEGFVDEGKKIKAFHTFTKAERIVVEGDAPGGSGVLDLMSDMAGYGVKGPTEDQPGAECGDVVDEGGHQPERSKSTKDKLMRRVSKFGYGSHSGVDESSSSDASKPGAPQKSKTMTVQPATDAPTTSTPSLPQGPLQSKAASSANLIQLRAKTEAAVGTNIGSSPTLADSSEPGGQAVIFKPAEPIILPHSDINIDVERRNRAPAGLGMSMVTSVGHVWFNTFFEGNGPEQNGVADESGVFEIEWDKMDGIKGSLRKGTRACDRIAVVWRSVKDVDGPDIVINEPGENSPVPQMRAADWTQEKGDDPEAGKGLGLRPLDGTDSEVVSAASSVHGVPVGDSKDGVAETAEGDEGDSLKGVKTSGPSGEEELGAGVRA
jgi:hypothetical protein